MVISKNCGPLGQHQRKPFSILPQFSVTNIFLASTYCSRNITCPCDHCTGSSVPLQWRPRTKCRYICAVSTIHRRYSCIMLFTVDSVLQDNVFAHLAIEMFSRSFTGKINLLRYEPLNFFMAIERLCVFRYWCTLKYYLVGAWYGWPVKLRSDVHVVLSVFCFQMPKFLRIV